jgi:hypothetical protein
VQTILRAAGLESYRADEVRVHDKTVIVVRPAGDAQELTRAARAALPDHDPVLVFDCEQVREPVFHHDRTPGELIAWARTADVDAELGRMYGYPQRDPEMPGTGDEGYHLESYDVTGFGEPDGLVVPPRPEPWTASAYLDPYGVRGTPGDLLLAVARRWYERYGAAPTTIGLANGFGVTRPPTDLADAGQPALEHVAVAGLSTRTTTLAYARALMELDRWCLYDRP